MKDIDKLLNKLLKQFLPKFIKSIQIDYGVGSAIAINNSDKKTSMNPLNLTKKDQEANTKIVSELVKGVNDDLAKKINYLVNKNITEKGGNKDLAKDLRGLFDKESPNYFDYKKRFDTIARTESSRLLNASSFNTAKRLGFTHKYINIVNDNRTSEQSKLFYDKYGTEDKAIPIEEEFFINYNGKEYRGLYPPFMPNDRDMVLFTNKE